MPRTSVTSARRLRQRRSQQHSRVVFATRIYEPEPAAAAFRLRAAVGALAADGVEVEVLTTRPPRSIAAAANVPGIKVRRWPVLRDRNQYVRGYLCYLSFDIPLIVRLLTVRRSDVVVVEPPPTTGAVVRAICALRRIRYVAYLPDVWSDGAAGAGAPGFVVKVVTVLERATMRGARRVITVTPEQAQRAIDLFGLRQDQIAVVRNGIDTSLFSADGPPALDVPAGPYAIYAGTISEWQGADVFVRAWPKVLSQLPDATLVFLGHGSAGQTLAQLRDDLGLPPESVQLRSLVSPAEAAAWQRGARVALASMQPGQQYDYFLPTKVFAGAACGTPVLFAGPGPGGELVKSERLGQAVAHDVEVVAAALVAMLAAPSDESVREHLVNWAREHADINRAGQQAARIIEEVAAATRL